jgi:Holliday junction resolvase RusA-like endonuclease
MRSRLHKIMYQIEIEVSGQPQGKGRPRFTKTGKAYTPAKTRDYENRIKAAAWAAMTKANVDTTDRPVHVDVIAFMDIPKSWSKKKRLEAEFGAFRPTAGSDLDNIVKAALDGIQGVVFVDDRLVHSIKARKTFCHPDRGPVLYISVSWTDANQVFDLIE